MAKMNCTQNEEREIERQRYRQKEKEKMLTTTPKYVTKINLKMKERVVEVTTITSLERKKSSQERWSMHLMMKSL